MSTLPVPRRTGHPWLRLLGVLVIVGAVLLGGTALFQPWAFYMGGRFHLLPYWQGWGRLHSNSAGGDYAVYVYFSPQVRRYSGLRSVTGTAVLCTPRGQKFSLKLGGSFGPPDDAASRSRGFHMPGPDSRDLNGRSASFFMYNRTAQHIFNGGNSRPDLELRGRWNNPDLALDDHGSLARNFDHNATLFPDGKNHPYMGEVSPVTLHEGGKSDFEAACAAVKSR
jgi:hypothetical protein